MSSKRIKDLTINGIDYRLSSSGDGSVDIIDNLTTADSESALSANQGKVLNEKIENIEMQSVVAEYNEETELLELNFNTPVQGIIEDTLESDNQYNALSAKQGKVLNEKITTVEGLANEATTIAKGKNKARVFKTTEAMNEWLSNENNKGLANVGDNLYIVDTNVPDWWISEVLEEPNADGKYYEVAQLETQKVDLTTIEEAIDEINSNLRVKMPDYDNLIRIVDTAMTEPYSFTSDEDGWLHVTVQSTNDAIGQLLVTINNNYSVVLCAPIGYLQQSQLVPIRKNDIVNCGLSSGRIRNIFFIPNV